MTADDARLETDFSCLIKDLVPVPALAQTHQNRVADGLTGEACTCGAEGNRQLQCAGFAQDALHFPFSFNVDDDLRDQQIETCIGAKGDGLQRVGDELFGGDDVFDAAVEISVGSR